MSTKHAVLKDTEINVTTFDPDKAGKLAADNRNAKLLGVTGDTSVIFLGPNDQPIGRAITHLQDELENKFGAFVIGVDFLPHPDHMPSELALGFKRIDKVHATIATLQVIAAKTQEEWERTSVLNNEFGIRFDPEGIAATFRHVTPFILPFESIKLTPNGLVIIQLTPSDDLLDLRKQLQDNGAKLKYKDKMRMKAAAITVGYFPDIENATSLQLQQLKRDFVALCQHLSGALAQDLRSGVKVSTDTIFYVKFARNDLAIAESTPILKGDHLCDACTKDYPSQLVEKRESERMKTQKQVIAK